MNNLTEEEILKFKEFVRKYLYLTISPRYRQGKFFSINLMLSLSGTEDVARDEPISWVDIDLDLNKS